MVKRYVVFIFLAVFLVAHQANATITRQLPASSHYEGFAFYDEEWEDWFGEFNRLRGRIDFAVYDTLTYPDEFIGADGFENPGDGRYILAHQIFNDYEGFSESPVGYFAVSGIDMAYVDIDAIGSQEDPAGGIEPTEQYFFDEDDDGIGEAVWDFGQFDEELILAGEHSWFLVFSSNQDWIPFTYVMTPPVPEPATLLLLGLGGLLLRRKRR